MRELFDSMDLWLEQVLTPELMVAGLVALAMLWVFLRLRMRRF